MAAAVTAGAAPDASRTGTGGLEALGLLGAGLDGPELDGVRLDALRLDGPELPGPDVPGPELGGPDVPGPELGGPDVPGPELPGAGFAGAGPDGAGTGPAGTGPAGTGPAGTGPASTGPVDTRLVDTQLVDTETLPLPVLIGSLRSHLDDLLVSPASQSKPDDGAREHDLPGDPLPAASPPGNPRHGNARHGDLLPGHRVPGHSRPRGRVASRVAGPAPAGGRMVRQHGAARGLLVTPWFAAATGFVIAASLWIYSPHPKLTFPAIATGPVRCNQLGCAPGFDNQGPGQLAIHSGSPLNPSKSRTSASAKNHSDGRTAASGLTFGYVVRPAQDGNFIIFISITGTRAIKNWKLSFVLPGDHIQSVLGAHWRAAGIDGLVARPFTGDPGQRGGGGGGHRGGGPGSDGNGQGGQGPGRGGQGFAQSSPGNHLPGGPGQLLAGFTVFVSGKTVTPARCRFDGAACTFHQLTNH